MVDQDLTTSPLLTLFIDGPAVTQSYPLLEMSAILIDVGDLLRIATLSTVSALVEESGPINIELRGTFPRPGSYIQEIGVEIIHLAHDSIVPLAVALPLPEIIKYVKDVLDLLEHLRKLFRRRKVVHVEKVSQDTAVVTSDGEEPLNVSVKTLDSLGPAIALLAQLDPKRFRRVQLKTSGGSELNIMYEPQERMMSGEFKELRSTANRLQKEAKRGGVIEIASEEAPFAVLPPGDPISLSGRVRELNFDSKSGHFLTNGNYGVRRGTYPFLVIGDQTLKSIRDLMGEEEVVMVCLVERRRRKVIRLHAISVRRVIT